MKKKQKKKYISFFMKRLKKGSAETIVLITIAVLGFLLAGGMAMYRKEPQTAGQPVDQIPSPNDMHQSLQLKTLRFISLVPTSAPTPALCKEGGANDEPDILAYPKNGDSITISQGGQLKVWVTDEGSPKISEGEVVDGNTGQITPGQRSGKAPDNYLWEPAVYIAPQTAETGGTPFFPTAIRGDYNNHPKNDIKDGAKSPSGPPIDPIPNGAKKDIYTAEFIWDVSSLNISSGATAEFVIHDGDDNRGVGCVTITIQ